MLVNSLNQEGGQTAFVRMAEAVHQAAYPLFAFQQPQNCGRRSGMEWRGLEGKGTEGMGLDWKGMERSGGEWNGMDFLPQNRLPKEHSTQDEGIIMYNPQYKLYTIYRGAFHAIFGQKKEGEK